MMRNGRRPLSPQKVFFSLLFNLILGGLFLGFFVVRPHTEAVVLRWGQYQRTVGPGIHWRMLMIEKTFKVKIDQPQRYTRTIVALTSDANLVSATLAIQYGIQQSYPFLFNMKNPIEYLQHIAISTLHAEVNSHSFAELLTAAGTQAIQKKVHQALHAAITNHPMGIRLVEVIVPTINPSTELKKDFEGVQQLQRQSQQQVYEARTKAAQAKHETALKIQQLYARANTQKQKTVIRAQSDISQFLALLPVYEEAPQLTTQRLYLEKIETILRKTPKALVVQSKPVTSQKNSPLPFSLSQLFNELKQPLTAVKTQATSKARDRTQHSSAPDLAGSYYDE